VRHVPRRGESGPSDDDRDLLPPNRPRTASNEEPAANATIRE